MPDQNLPTPEPQPHPFRALAPSGRRAVASAAIYAARNETGLLSASTLVDAIDGACWGVLAAAGLTPLEAKIVLATLWADR
jgi:hypothetical protein